MYLHKTAGASGKVPPEKPVQNAPASKARVPVQEKPSAAAPPAAPRSASAIIAAAGLPVDKLSASIISFARFFSLPLKPEVMAAIRHQAMAQPAMAAALPESAKHAAGASGVRAADNCREIISLAAAAAESKGVELHPNGLEKYAEAIDPDWQKRHNPDDQNRRERKNKNRRDQGKDNPPSKIGSITAAILKETALETMAKNLLLDILNRLPAQDKRRWIVLPFHFSDDNREFNVSLRILLEAGNQAPNRAACMALDIAENSSLERPEAGHSVSGTRRLFVLESDIPANQLSACRLSVYLQPEPPPKAVAPLVRELSGLLEIPPERITVKTRPESFPCESGCHNDQLLSVDEAV
ncbi:MAG: hypothetical protein FWC24_06490 [Treponema sp.]|nr:hypothetical protein [Treponema sp.]